MDKTLGIKYISVLMPVYNAEKYLFDSIRSILDQTYPYFEFLILNDGSTDKSIEILKKFEAQDPRIRILNNPRNYGVAISRNILVKEAKFDFLAWMDADDISLPERLEKEISVLSNDETIDLVCSQISIISEDGEYICDQPRMNYSLYYDLHFFCSIPNPTVLCKKHTIVQSGGYAINMPPAEDFDLWSRLMKRNKLYRIEEPLVKYRKSHNSISNVVLKNNGYNKTQEIVQQIISEKIPHIKFSSPELLIMQEDFNKACELKTIQWVLLLRKLNLLNKKILMVNNPNRNVQFIRKAISSKKEKLIKQLSQHSNIFQVSLILILNAEIFFTYMVFKIYLKGKWQK